MLLNIHHGFNFRDMGGYTTADMHTIKKHKLIRSGKLDELSDRDVRFLSDYGVRFDVDFRSADEKKAEPDRIPTGASYFSLPVFPTDETKVSKTQEDEFKQFALDPHAGYKNMLQTYADMVLQSDAQKAYRQFFDVLLSNPDDGNALLFHCSAGKDRTGMGAVYLMSALGVDMHTIKQDYIAANNYIQTPLKQILNHVEKQGANANLQQSITDLWTVKEDYLDSALHAIDSNYGDMRNYLHTALDLSTEQVADLQRIYLVQ